MHDAFPSAAGVRRLCFAVIAAMLCLRFAHVHLLWADEDYHLAAAIQVLHGKVPYRDFWYDKPPLSALYYLLIAGHAGWLLRILDTAYVALACYLIYQLARQWRTPVEAWVAAGLLAFFTTFYLPSAVIPFAADAVMLVPHLAAMYCAQRKAALWAGIWAGIAFLANAKALFVLAACAVWLPGALPLLCAGFAVPVFCGLAVAMGSGAFNGYLEQVWSWGLIYAARSPVVHPFMNGSVRTLNWLGFHGAIGAGAIYGWLYLPWRDRFRLGSWLLLSFAAVSLGSRFAPHYFLQLLPAMIILASYGFVAAWRERRNVTIVSALLLLLVPFIRFGPRYFSLAYDDAISRAPRWIDVGMDLDSQDAARQMHASSRPGDTLFVWGYRPDLYVYTRMASPGRFWDSQPLTGVPADRHLWSTAAIYDSPALAANRQELTRSQPTWIVDGLGLLNPKLSLAAFADLQKWLSGYRLVGRTKLCLIYRKK